MRPPELAHSETNELQRLCISVDGQPPLMPKAAVRIMLWSTPLGLPPV